jgi:ATP-dependent Clp protease protease subunit
MIVTNASKNEMILDGIVGSSWYDDGITATAVRKALDEFSGKRVTVRINSPGGVADEGIAIYNVLSEYSGGIDTMNDALAASAASVIFLAGKKRTMGKGSRVMIHRALTIEMGNADRMRKTADTLETYDKSLVEIYREYLGKTDEEIMQLLSDETWYNSQAAIDAGLATGQSGESTGAKAQVAAWFKKPPEDLALASVKRSYAALRASVAGA